MAASPPAAQSHNDDAIHYRRDLLAHVHPGEGFWLQGIVMSAGVDSPGHWLLDDGSEVGWLDFEAYNRSQERQPPPAHPRVGMLVEVLGKRVEAQSGSATNLLPSCAQIFANLSVHRWVPQVDDQADSETMFNLLLAEQHLVQPPSNSTDSMRPS